LSGDEHLADSVRSGDPYIAFAIRAGLAPPGATKLTHDRARSVCKTIVLGVNYGMGVRTFAYRAGVCDVEAARLLRMLAATYPTFWKWSKEVVDSALLNGFMTSVFGWVVHVTGTTRATTLKNFPMQANGAEMLRLACCVATERGVQVCAPVHDALLIEAPSDEIEDAVAVTRSAMAQSASVLLGGMELGTDVAITRWPDRYSDPADVAMWDRVSTLLAGAK
jgi:DNA polymerase I-like protein with 3'-5' exonuclease and polymerase domains